MTYKVISTEETLAQVADLIDVTSLKVTGNPSGRHVARVNLRPSLTGVDALLDPTGSRLQPQVVVSNSFKGECAFTINVGFLRAVCSNGMVVGTSYYGERIIHREGQTADRKIAAIRQGIETAAEYLTRELPELLHSLHDTKLTEEEALAIGKYLPLTQKNHSYLDYVIRNPQREADQGNTLYTLWNMANEVQVGWSRPSMANQMRNANLLDDIECLAQNLEALVA